MKVIHTIQEFRAWRRACTPITAAAFVPTMGALHEGHASLVRQAKAMAGTNGVALSSIFVNPTQFGPNEDFARYPRTLDSDVAILAAAGCDAVFVPSAQEMYGPAGGVDPAAIAIDPGPMGSILEGAIRPGHFRGVCTVVAKLLNITSPTHMLMGRKDFQQQAILRRMCLDLNVPVEVVTCDTVREPNGLAMSSRNRYLSTEERTRAIALHEALTFARDEVARGQTNVAAIEQGMKDRIERRNLALQYAVLADATTLELLSAKGGIVTSNAVALLAAKLGNTRLIDNMLLAKQNP